MQPLLLPKNNLGKKFFIEIMFPFGIENRFSNTNTFQLVQLNERKCKFNYIIKIEFGTRFLF